ncbi:MAG: hypothetical protein ACE14Q_02920 [Acidobacteriota bacterium]
MDFSENWLKEWASESKNNFEKNHRIKSFSEYIKDLSQKPYSLSRNSVQYLLDMLEFFGEKKVYSLGTLFKTFKLFEQEIPSSAAPPLVGQEGAVMEIYSILKDFVIEGGADKIVLLHGPGSCGKSLIIEWLMRGIEEYSRKSAGCLYTFHWVFPKEGGKRMGFGEKTDIVPSSSTYAYLSSDQISFRLSCDVNDSPLLLIPPKRRITFLEELLKNADDSEKEKFIPSKYILEAELCGRCRQVFDALHDEYGGDVEKILMHIQVRRLYISRKYQRGAAVISPQETPDAGARLISTDTNWDAIPSALQHLTIEQIQGSIIGANNGIAEFADFLSRPPELNKYLLSLVTRGGFEVAQNSVSLNTTIFATAIEENLDSFKQSHDFPAFKGRMTFVTVPYILERRKESEIHLKSLEKIGEFKHISPMLHLSSGLSAVLTRLFKPLQENYSKEFKETATNITPYEKAVMYDSFSDFAPELVSFDSKKMKLIFYLSQEFKKTQYYEGRFGFSPRDISDLFYDEAYNKENSCISIFDFLDGFLALTKDRSLYKFLELKPESFYHDILYLAEIVKMEHLKFFEDTALSAMKIYDEKTPFLMVKEYFSYLIQQAEPKEFADLEKRLSTEENAQNYRKQIREKIFESMKESDWGFVPLFCQEVLRIKKSKIEPNKAKIKKTLNNALLILSGGENNVGKEDLKETEKFVETMIEKYSYCPNCLYENSKALLEEKFQLPRTKKRTDITKRKK